MMGFFDRSKKVKKAQQASPPRPPPQPAGPASQPPLTGAPQQLPLRHQQPAAPFQPAGYLPAPPGWTAGPSAGPPPPYQYNRQYPPPIVVNQHYYLAPPPVPVTSPYRPQNGGGALSRLNLGSMVNLAADLIPMNLPRVADDGHLNWNSHCGGQALDQGAALYDQISTKFDNVMSMIDQEKYVGNEGDLFMYQPSPPSPPTLTPMPAPQPSTDRGLGRKSKPSRPSQENHKGQTTAVAATVISGNYFAKVDLYANARLPLNLPPLKLYIPTWPILCLAAQYSESVYSRPRGAERVAHIAADWLRGSKAMLIKSVPMDSVGVLVFAIRGTATFMDWAVNLRMSPASPRGFLDDDGNLCHAGFLAAARSMVRPVAQRLRQLLAEDSARASFSLLVTGHSAGGAVAALLYAHMLAVEAGARSELSELVGVFKRVHCVTFGAPPVSLLPLAKPPIRERELRKSLFLSFVNEGDPVARADKAYVRSLLELLATPAPGSGGGGSGSGSGSGSGGGKGKSSSALALVGGHGKKKNASKSSLASSHKSGRSAASRSHMPVWKVPPATLSSAGRIVVLRSGDPRARLKDRKTVEERLNEGVVAQIATDEQLRGVIWGDPVCHVMRLYAGRVEVLAVAAVTGQHR